MVELSANTSGSLTLTANNSGNTNVSTNGEAQRAKSWAVGTGLIDGLDYSSKYYATQAKASELIITTNLDAIEAVNANATNINTVANSTEDVNSVGSNILKVTAVADGLTAVNTVAANISSIGTVSGDIDDVVAIANAITDINDIADDLTNIDTVAANISDINDLADDLSNVNTVASNITSVDILSSNIANVNAVNSNSANINTVAGNISNVNTVAGISSDVTSVKNNASNITAVANDLTNINAVAADLTNIDNASTYASNAAASADLAEDWATKMDGTVDGSEFSAKYYAQQSAQSQVQANWTETSTTSKAYIQNKPTIPYYGTSDTAAATATKEVSIPAITTLNVGQMIVVNPTVTSTVANMKIKLNDFEAFTILYGGTATTTSTDSIVWSSYVPSIFVYDISADGTTHYWRFVCHGQDLNTTYTLNYSPDAGLYKLGTGSYVVSRYSLMMQTADMTWEKITDPDAKYSTATTKTVNTHGFRLGQLKYYSSTSNFATGATIPTNAVYDKAASVDLRYSTNCGATPGWTDGDYIYLVGTIGNDGLFYLDTTTWWTNTLPSTNDGKLYMRVGLYVNTYAYSCSLLTKHPVFYHDGTSIKEYVIADNKQDVISDLSAIRSGASAGATALQSIASSDVTSALGYTPVNKAGDTMSGSLTINNNSLFIKHPIARDGSNPSSGSWKAINFADSSSPQKRFALIESSVQTSGSSSLALYAYKNQSTDSNNSFFIGWDGSGNKYAEINSKLLVGGVLTVEGSAVEQIIKNNINYSTYTTAGETYSDLQFQNYAGARFNTIRSAITYDNTGTVNGSYMIFGSNKLNSSAPDGIKIICDSNNNLTCTAPVPPSNSNGNNIATTSWVRTYAQSKVSIVYGV